MLRNQTMVAFLATSKPDAARAFFEGVLGLKFVSNDEHLVVFESDTARLMLQTTDVVTPAHGTALGWQVSDLKAVTRGLIDRGVPFERFAGMDQDELGIWRPGGPSTGVAWFKDPDGNLLSLSQAGG